MNVSGRTLPGPTPAVDTLKRPPGERAGMVRCWLVERTFDDKGLVRLVYATPDGERAVTSERSSAMLRRSSITAATDVEEADLDPVTDEATRKRYATEAERTAENHDPDDPI